MMELIRNYLFLPISGALFPAGIQPYAVSMLAIITKIVAILVPVLITVAWLPYAERKIIGYMQVRIGPNRRGPRGWLQPIADAMKLIFKEIIIPSGASKTLFIIAPILSVAPSLAAWAVIPFNDVLVLSDINAGLLYILALTSLAVYGIIIAGWASNSKYAFLGAIRYGPECPAYERASGGAWKGTLRTAGRLNLSDIVA